MINILMVFLMLVLLPFSLFAKEQRSTMPEAQYVLPQVVKEWKALGKKFVLIDVREPQEYAVGHLEGAINITYLDVERVTKDFDRQQPYVFYCTLSAWRAPYAANAMADLGFKNAYVLSGGIKAWKEGGQIIYANDANVNGMIAAYPQGLAKVLHHPPDRAPQQKIHITRKELAKFNGMGGRPAYVAVNGIIYDVTKSRLWRGGVHAPSNGMAVAGEDLTEMLEQSPHGDKHLKDFPVVGWLVN